MSQSPPHSEAASIEASSGHDSRKIYTVSSLNEAVRVTLERNIGAVDVEGEISNIARPASGHIYFTLKDAHAQIRCAMFKNRNRRLRFAPENGLQVMARGKVSLYPARGDYQLVVDALEPAGEGALRLRFEQLKQKLLVEGLFEADLKQPLPQWPVCVGVITSPTGAAIRDVLTVLKRRCPAVEVIVYPCAVQGADAVSEIVRAVEVANKRRECDVLILARGGGSLEDLWSFNEERVARAIYASTLPVVSGVGHETDFSISDMVADVRAPTPSAAAELVSPDTAEFARLMRQLSHRLGGSMRRRLDDLGNDVRNLQRRFASPRRAIEIRSQRCDDQSARLIAALSARLRVEQSRIASLRARTYARSPASIVQSHGRELTFLRHRLVTCAGDMMRTHNARLERLSAVLESLGPTATLDRGYAIVSDEQGNIVRDAREMASGQVTVTRLRRGKLRSRVEQTVDPEPSG